MFHYLVFSNIAVLGSINIISTYLGIVSVLGVNFKVLGT